MTRESDGGRAQKTVAELLAEHGGGQVGASPRRRRRRAAEDDDAGGGGRPGISDTAPQAIIERVRSEGGTPQEPHGNGYAGPPAPHSPHETNGAMPRPPAAPQPPARGRQGSGYFTSTPPGAPPPGPPPGPPDGPGPGGPPPTRTINGVGGAGRTQRRVPPAGGPHAASGPAGPAGPAGPSGGPGQGAPGAPGQPGPGAQPPNKDTSLSARLDGLGSSDTVAPSQGGGSGYFTPQQPDNSGQNPLPPRRRMALRNAPPQAPPEPSTEQFSAFGPPKDARGPAQPAQPPHDEPPAGIAGLSGWRQRRQQRQQPQPPQQPQQPPQRPPQAEATEVVPPMAPPDADGGPPTGYFVPEFEDSAVSMPGLPLRRGVLDDDPQTELVPSREGYDGEYGDDYAYDDGYDDGYDGYGDEYGEYDDDYDDYYEEDAYPDEREHDDVAPERPAADASAAKQWLALAGQLALGVVGGAGVWLGFNWLWGQMSAAALIAALVVTVCLVWIVRKVRKADDMQTTLLAVLVGLVVTVSPAALLLVAK